MVTAEKGRQDHAGFRRQLHAWISDHDDAAFRVHFECLASIRDLLYNFVKDAPALVSTPTGQVVVCLPWSFVTANGTVQAQLLVVNKS